MAGLIFYLALPSLSEGERIWYTIQSLIQAIENGGVISYYYNSGADDLSDCIEALEYLEQHQMVSLLHQVNLLFGGDVPKDLEARNEIINSWPDDDSINRYLTLLDESALRDVDTIETVLAEFIAAQGLAT